MKSYPSEDLARIACLRQLTENLHIANLYFGDNDDCQDIFGASIAENFHSTGAWFVWHSGTFIVSDKESDILEWALEFAGQPADICTYQKGAKWYAEIQDWT